MLDEKHPEELTAITVHQQVLLDRNLMEMVSRLILVGNPLN